MDAATRDRTLRVLGVQLRGHPHPGQHYKHGWIPIAGSTMEVSMGKALSSSEIDDVYGDVHDRAEFAPGALAELNTDGTVSIRLAADKPDHWYGFGDLTQEEAAVLADDLDWAVGRAGDAAEHGHRPPDPVNGLLDWRAAEDQVVGYGPDGTIQIGFAMVGGDPNNYRVIDLSSDEAIELQKALHDMALTDLSDEDQVA